MICVWECRCLHNSLVCASLILNRRICLSSMGIHFGVNQQWSEIHGKEREGQMCELYSFSVGRDVLLLLGSFINTHYSKTNTHGAIRSFQDWLEKMQIYTQIFYQNGSSFTYLLVVYVYTSSSTIEKYTFIFSICIFLYLPIIHDLQYK